MILRALRIKLPNEARQRLVTMLEEIILEHRPRLVPGVAETLPMLAERYALAVVCDAAMTPGRVLRRVLADYGLEQWFGGLRQTSTTGPNPTGGPFSHRLRRSA